MNYVPKHSQNLEESKRPLESRESLSNRWSTAGHAAVLVAMNFRPLRAWTAAELVRSNRLTAGVDRLENTRRSSREAFLMREEVLRKKESEAELLRLLSSVFFVRSVSSGSSWVPPPGLACWTLWTATESSLMSSVISTYSSSSPPRPTPPSLRLVLLVGRSAANLAFFLDVRLGRPSGPLKADRSLALLSLSELVSEWAPRRIPSSWSVPEFPRLILFQRMKKRDNHLILAKKNLRDLDQDNNNCGVTI